MPPTLVMPTDAEADILDAWYRERGPDAFMLPDPPSGQLPARLWRHDGALWWTVPMPNETKELALAGWSAPP